jgi:hypothetical protein
MLISLSSPRTDGVAHEEGATPELGLRLGSFGEMSRRQALVVTWDTHTKFVAVKSKYSILSNSSIAVLIEFPSIPGNIRAPFHKEFGIQNPILTPTRSAMSSTRFNQR